MSRILLITPYFHPHKGGSQKYALELYYHLMKSNPKIKVDVICYNTDKSPSFEKYKGLNIYRLPCFEILKGQFAIPNYIELIKLLIKLKSKNKYLFINAHTRFFESSWWAPLAAKYLGTKSMLTDHCATHPIHSFFLVSWLAFLVDKLIVPLFVDLYDIVTVTNKAAYSFIKTLGVKNPYLIYGGVDTQIFKSENTSEVSRRRNTTSEESEVKIAKETPPRWRSNDFDSSDGEGIGGKKIIVSFVGRMIYSKGPHLLFEAAKEAVNLYPNVHFFFAGEGGMNKSLEKTKIERISFLGTLEQEKTAELLDQTDILVFPSLHHEGFPNVLLEAGASGCSIITTNRGGTKEIIKNGKTGIIINPDKDEIIKALKILIEDKKKRKNLQESLRIHIRKNFDWRIILADFEELMNKHMRS